MTRPAFKYLDDRPNSKEEGADLHASAVVAENSARNKSTSHIEVHVLIAARMHVYAASHPSRIRHQAG